MAEQINFTDRMQWDGEEKTAISVRDGVLEYLGAEIGKDPADKIFTVYRSPATIANVVPLMAGIPLIDEHVAPGDEESAKKAGSVLSGDMIDMIDSAVNSTLAIRNKVDVHGDMITMLEDGKRELSLGYTGELIEHDKYDFEQRNIQPFHLAVVDAGRCGSACSFIDQKGNRVMLNKAFLDAEGQPSLEQIAQIMAQLPEAIKALPIDKLSEVMPALQEIVAVGKAADPSSAAEEEPAMDEDAAEPEQQEVEDMDMEEEEEKKKTPITDSAAFKDALAAATKTYAETVEKAREFVPSDYCFADKSVAQIQRDALATEHKDQQFSDEELAVAFKLLKKTKSTLTDFGDQKAASRFTDLKDKEL